MIRDLSESLRAMLDDPALAGRFPELAAARREHQKLGRTWDEK